ncbi:hypothetical protein HPB49_001961 [Dermacentor silvarum]|uniref:Uncharacterized protein n=1 Tax=Dermacentor silvarum TaxID=543639 RepID=A0ACB8DMB1_DERSI|nr:hypothetical protein HPB49_001961 [Dermacentor silvarum]
MINSTHRLTGFGSLLEGRRVPFVEPLPSQRVCCVCDVVSSVTKKLPCCHVLCNGPCGRALEMRDGRDCPVDGYKAEENEVVVVTSALVDLEQFEVFCINRACDFKGTLRLMMEHFLLCEYGEGMCGKCGETMTRGAAARHGWDCRRPARLAAPATSPERSAAVRIAAELRSRTESLCDLALRDGSVSAITEGATSLEALANEMEELLRRLASANVSVRGAAEALSAPPGPFRSPSEPRAWATLCKVLLPEQTTKVDSMVYTLAGYTFHLKVRRDYRIFARADGRRRAALFELKIVRGTWDSCVRWPFEKRVTLTIPHLRDQRMDVKIAMEAVPRRDLQRHPNRRNFINRAIFQSVESTLWDKIFPANYVFERILYVHVEFV